MAYLNLPDTELLRKLLEYDGNTGLFRWKARSPDMFGGSTAHCNRWNGRLAGKAAGMLRSDGYVSIAVYNQKYLAHRLAWSLHHGFEPIEIDHINGDRADNRLVNLREVTRTENNMNSALQSNNVSGMPGVTWDNQTKRWRATIKQNSKTIDLGRWDTIYEAQAARKTAERLLGFHENHGRRGHRATGVMGT